MELKAFMNSPMLWAVSALMVLGILTEAALFTMVCFKNGPKLGVSKEDMIAGMRTAAITAIGPSLAPVITLLALMAVIGGPTGWMRMNDIGAARTELAMCAMAADAAGTSLDASKFTAMGFIFCLWGMALNNSGWIVVGGYGAPSLVKAVDYLNEKCDKAWMKVLMTACSLGLFGTLLVNNVIAKKGGFNVPNLTAGLVAFVTMIALGIVFKGNKRIAEFSLGISMIVGMCVSAALY